MTDPEKHTSQGECFRNLSPKDILVEEAGFDEEDLQCLHIIRCFCQSFSPAAQDDWIDGFMSAEKYWGRSNGPRVAHQVMRVLQEMRLSRRSIFMFSSPNCPCCRRVLSEHERRLVGAIQLMRNGKSERAMLEVMMLCEGNPTQNVMQEIQDLADMVLVASKPVSVTALTPVQQV